MLAFDFDSDQTVVDAPDPALTRRIAEVLDAAVPHPWIGRQLFGLFRRAGLREVRVVPHVICLSGAAGFAIYQQLNQGTIDRAMQAGQITAEEVAAWWAALEQAGETEMFFTLVPPRASPATTPAQHDPRLGRPPWRRRCVPDRAVKQKS